MKKDISLASLKTVEPDFELHGSNNKSRSRNFMKNTTTSNSKRNIDIDF